MPSSAILVVDDESEIREGLELLLASEGYEVGLADSAESALARLDERPFDLLLLDVSLPDRSGLEVLKEIRGRDPGLPVIMITAFGSIDMARQAFKSGVQDYITKPWSNDELLAQVAQTVESRRLREENVQLKRAFKQRYNFPNIVGKSEKFLAMLDLVRQVAASRSTVLIYGESGTGKELIAKAIHAASSRAERPFVPINTGSMPVDLLESLLFGHVRGAFTGAVAPKKGLFEVADQGTLFLDEISTIGPETQAKLLRVMQEREFMRLGGTETVKTDVRILAASNADLCAMVRDGRFREDLYHRLNVITICLPALRDRKQDIPLLVDHFLERYCQENRKPGRRIAPAAMRLLVDYNWPGNVRELENVIERAVVLSSEETLGPDLLPETLLTREVVEGIRLPVAAFAGNGSGESLAPADPAASPRASGLSSILEEVERRLIVDMLDRTAGNQTEAAERLELPLSTLNQKIKRLGIDHRRRSSRAESKASPAGSEPSSEPAPAPARTTIP